jgi:magnesium chelatase family protein
MTLLKGAADADLDGADKVGRLHLAEALLYRAIADEIQRAA